ncbi:acyl-acyl carrier protein thioesterase TE3, chloroplastic-like [Lolium rigidum]|uniref:acyl-acyl carrier protein thioesterase TE3, chloroplastic-like n=1 Tax=Lolium rigidum TaxID=89674 RepID=UPI001F5CADBC|nr:acyl-acyl carrier protein thioesterase TE3, chloroplastic-like [Lolium rigidum]
MQQIGSIAPLANKQFPQHLRQVYNAGGGRSKYGHLVMPHGQAYLHQHQVKVAPRASGRLLAVSTVNTNQDSNMRKGKYFEVERKVNDTELDEFGVVNAAIYISYIRNGLSKLLESVGISVDSMTSKGNALAYSEVQLKYIAPLRIGDKFVVKVKPTKIKGVRVIVEHRIETLPDHKLILEAKGTIVCLDKDYHPTRVFPEVSAKVLQFFSSKDE